MSNYFSIYISRFHDCRVTLVVQVPNNHILSKIVTYITLSETQVPMFWVLWTGRKNRVDLGFHDAADSQSSCQTS